MPVPWGRLAGRQKRWYTFTKGERCKGRRHSLRPDGLPAAALRLCRSAKWLQPLDRHLGAACQRHAGALCKKEEI